MQRTRQCTRSLCRLLKKEWYDCWTVPCEISRVLGIFIHHGGNVSCRVSGRRKLGHGLDVPCTYILERKKKFVVKVQKNVTIKHITYTCDNCVNRLQTDENYHTHTYSSSTTLNPCIMQHAARLCCVYPVTQKTLIAIYKIAWYEFSPHF